MKKQMHILEGIMIILVVFIASLFLVWFVYHIYHEQIDTTYMWNVRFDNLEIVSGSKGTIEYKDDSLVLDVTLKEFNEFSEFSIEVVNSGTIDAILDNYDINVNSTNDILKWSVTYIDGEEINRGDIIKSNSSRVIVVKILYPLQEEKIYPELNLSLALNMHYIAAYR